MAELPI